MATNNAIGIPITISMANGGTAVTTLTQYGPLIGNGSTNIQSITAGTTGQLLQSTTGSNPSFTSSLSADYAFTSATASVNRVLTVSNTDNTGAATSAAKVQITVGGSNVGDPKKTHTVTGGGSFTRGIDNSASDAFKLSASTALGTTDTWIMTTAGERTMPLQPAVVLRSSVSFTNVTGAGTQFTIPWDTIIIDQTSDYNTGTGQFTAPVSGRFIFRYTARAQNLSVLMTSGLYTLVTSNRSYGRSFMNWQIEAEAGVDNNPMNCEAFVDMDSGDICYATVTISGGAGDTVIIEGVFSSSRFSGYLVC